LDLPEYGGRLAAVGSYAYVVNDGHLRVVDLSDRAAPRPVASYDDLASAHDVAAKKDQVYVADGYNGLVVLRRTP
jgi:hypothetical protein